MEGLLCWLRLEGKRGLLNFSWIIWKFCLWVVDGCYFI